MSWYCEKDETKLKKAGFGPYFKNSYLSTRMQSLADDEVDDKPGDEETAGKLPLNCSEAVLNAAILLQNSVPKMRKRSQERMS